MTGSPQYCMYHESFHLKGMTLVWTSMAVSRTVWLFSVTTLRFEVPGLEPVSTLAHPNTARQPRSTRGGGGKGGGLADGFTAYDAVITLFCARCAQCARLDAGDEGYRPTQGYGRFSTPVRVSVPITFFQNTFLSFLARWFFAVSQLPVPMECEATNRLRAMRRACFLLRFLHMIWVPGKVESPSR